VSDGDKVRVTTFVAVAPADAFAVFTEEIDQWWRRGHAYRISGRDPGTFHLEPRLGGRIFEQYGETGSALHEVGTITGWDPPNRLEFEWRAVNFVPGESTTVEVLFEASGEGTRVTLEHRGWTAIRGDHPVRHGQDVAPFLRDLAMWWAGLLTSMRELSASRAR
jgi:uncharacterized protein YndB with AHSA1/START domain